MSLKRIGLTGSVNSQARVTGRRITLNRVSLRRFPFPLAPAAVSAFYIEDVFSTHLYTGNGRPRQIENGISLASGPNIAIGTQIGGGFFAGFINLSGYGSPEYALIVSGINGQGFGSRWQNDVVSVAGTSSSWDGVTNTDSAATSGTTTHPAALAAYNSSLNGYTDWYLPSLGELQQIYSGFGPSVTNIDSFKTGGANAFAAADYWSSTQASATTAWAISFSDGSSSGVAKTNTARYFRIVRRISVNDPLLTSYNTQSSGGMTWFKSRSATDNNVLFDTERGSTKAIYSNDISSEQTLTTALTIFNPSGFNIGSSTMLNTSGTTYVSWTFRKQAKFFDVVTYTGNGVAGRTVPHNLGSIPGMIIVKRTSGATTNWQVYHRSLGATQYFLLDTQDSAATNSNRWNNTEPTATEFTVGSNAVVNGSGSTYIAYLFAHNAGGFGATGSDNIITCGSFTSSSSGVTIDLGFEPQWLFVMRPSATDARFVFDNMRDFLSPPATETRYLGTNLASGEAAFGAEVGPTSTGFKVGSYFGNGPTVVYMAIRRGPMKTPTSGTSVFNTVFSAASGNPAFVSGFPVDFATWKFRNSVASWNNSQRLTSGKYQEFNTTAAEAAYADFRFDFQNGWASAGQGSGTNLYSYCFRRAPGFFDVVCYTGTGVTDRVVTHNLTVAPELIITKSRSSTDAWAVGTGFDVSSYQWLYLNLTNSALSLNYSAKSRINSQPTSTQYTIATDSEINGSGLNYVAYLFATCPGVSKVGSYTGTGVDGLQINCGFTAGARFVMIKRTDSANDWHVFDTVRGINAGADPYLKLNTSGAEVTGDDIVDTYASGFVVNAYNGVNANGGTYIFLAIA